MKMKEKNKKSTIFDSDNLLILVLTNSECCKYFQVVYNYI